MVISVVEVNRAPQTWLLPTALVGYVALTAASDQGDLVSWGILVIPLAVAWGLTYVSRKAEGGQLATSVEGVRAAVMGMGLYLAAVTGPADSAALRAASGVAQGLLTAGTLLCIARLSPPAGLLQGHPAARSLDALALSVVIWTAISSAALLRALAPDEFPLDPIALDLAFIFGALGSLLLLCASFIRTRLLRGLELGVGDRAQAALSVAVAGTIVGAGSGFIALSTSDRIAGGTLVVTCVAVVLALSAANASRVTQVVRGFLALMLLGTPTALIGAWIAMRSPNQRALVALSVAGASMAVGLLARSVAKPLGPEGSRWLAAVTRAMDAALHPEPDMGIRAALLELRKAEPTSTTRPEVFRCDPPGLLSVDIAGYLTDEPADYPAGLEKFAIDEPFRTLRAESVNAAQVRKPEVRPVATWFDAHQAKTATVLMDEVGPVGLLILPSGRRKSSLTMEEAELLGKLADRLAGLISVTASLRRARTRELQYREETKAADAKAARLSEQLEEQHRSDQDEAEARAEILRAAAHSPAAQTVLVELESTATSPTLQLETPLGVDPIPWAAHAHLSREKTPRPLVVLDCSERGVRTQEPWALEAETAPWKRAAQGTLVLLHPGALPEPLQLRMGEALETQPPLLLISCSTGEEVLVPRLERQLDGPSVKLPTLADRAEDLQALILNHLVQLGLAQRGSPFGIERPALFRMIQRAYPGNDAELKGLLASATALATGELITLEDLRRSLHEDENEDEDRVGPASAATRSRSRLAPRAPRR